MHAATDSLTARTTGPRDRAIAIWLLVVCAMIYAMVVLGGITRLTGSGLSMVEWDPIFGIVPPLSEHEWRVAFDKYRASPEYRKVNIGMDLAGFKSIYWVEYAHRVLGRTIGTVFLLPFLFFWWRGWIRRGLTPKLVTMFVLGGLQGLLGWWMVKSGLVDDPHVSQYRLTAHLLAAFVIYAFVLWVALGLLQPAATPVPATRRPRLFAASALGLVFLTVASGGLVAGLKAGYAYATFPLMDGRLVPAAIGLLEPWWRNIFENIATVQFDHRLLATLTLVTLFALGWVVLRRCGHGQVRLAAWLVLAAVVLQYGLGIATLLSHVALPLASTHQAGALALVTALLFLLHSLRRAGASGA